MRIALVVLAGWLTMATYTVADDDSEQNTYKPSVSTQSRDDNARDAARDTRETAKDAADQAKDSSSETARQAGDSGVKARERVSSSTSRDRDERSRERSSRDRDHEGDRSSYSRRDRDDDDFSDDREHEDRSSRSDRDDRSYSRDDRDDRSDRRRRELSRLGATFSSDDDDRLVISRFDRDSALNSAGLRRGDAIISVDGRRVRNERDFQRWIYDARRPAVVVWRDGRERTIYLDDLRSARAAHRGGATLGVAIDPRYHDEVVIEEVYSHGAADEAELERGDTILAIDGDEVSNLSELRNVLRQYSPGDEVEVNYLRNDREETTVATLESANRQSRANEIRTYATRTYDDGVRRSAYREGEIYIDNDADWDRRGTEYQNRGRTFRDGDDYRDDRRDGRGVVGRRARVER